MCALGLQLGDHDDRQHDLVLVEASDGAGVGEQHAGVQDERAALGRAAAGGGSRCGATRAHWASERGAARGVGPPLPTVRRNWWLTAATRGTERVNPGGGRTMAHILRTCTAGFRWLPWPHWLLPAALAGPSRPRRRRRRCRLRTSSRGA